MPASTRRRLEMLQLSERLRQYASHLTPDFDASSFLVHQALSAAFAEAELRPSVGLEAGLRRDIDRNFAFARARPAGANGAVLSFASQAAFG